MTEYRPPKLTAENITRQTQRLLGGLRVVEEVAKEQGFSHTSAVLYDEEISIDINAAGQILHEILVNVQALKKSDAPIRAETFEGMHNKMKKLDGSFRAIRTLLIGELRESIMYDRDVALKRAQAIRSTQARDDTLADVRKMHIEGLLEMQHAMTNLMAMQVLLDYELKAMEKMQEIDKIATERLKGKASNPGESEGRSY